MACNKHHKKKVKNSSLLTTIGSWISLKFCKYFSTLNMIFMFLMCGRLIMTWPLLCNYHTSYEWNECKRSHCWWFHDLMAFSKKVENKLTFTLTLSWPTGHICSTYKESFQVRWDNNIPVFLHAAFYLEVSLFCSTSQNAFSRKTAALHTVSFVHCCFAGKCILTGSME